MALLAFVATAVCFGDCEGLKRAREMKRKKKKDLNYPHLVHTNPSCMLTGKNQGECSSRIRFSNNYVLTLLHVVSKNDAYESSNCYIAMKIIIAHQ